MNYYNEFDRNAARWIEALVEAGEIPAGVVDDRSITEVNPSEFRLFKQCHFFTGIAGWPLALQMAGVSPALPLWTGSCPCQPFSSAGNRKGKQDERHLWPAWFSLVRECRPQLIFGEQVENAIRHGWIDDLQTDLEREGYAVGFSVLGAHSINAPHQRQRLYWGAVRRDRVEALANTASPRQTEPAERGIQGEVPESDRGRPFQFERGVPVLGMANTSDNSAQRGGDVGELDGPPGRAQAEARERERCGDASFRGNPDGSLASAHGSQFREFPPTGKQSLYAPGGGVDHAEHSPGHGRDQRGTEPERRGPASGCEPGQLGHAQPGRREGGDQQEGQTTKDWETTPTMWAIYCRDGKLRPVGSQPGDEPLAYGIPQRVEPIVSRMEGMGVSSRDSKRVIRTARTFRTTSLRGYGNAIHPGLAAIFVQEFLGALEEI